MMSRYSLAALIPALLLVVSCEGNDQRSADAGTDTGSDAGHGGDSGNADAPSSCEPNPCGEEGRTRCVVEDGIVRCECDAGHHEQGGRCIPDETCADTTCNGHGTCAEQPEGGVICSCDEGWTGTFCEVCDDTAGYHPDGLGGCTNDSCLPNPCEEPNRTVCVDEGGEPQCQCDVDYHLDRDQCVADDDCVPTSCNGHGSCDVVDGRVYCDCEPGYVGDSCEDCDFDSGYHPDGSGGCTDDPCLPNPCTIVDHRTVCSDNEGRAECSCEAGFHDDGVGGCTDDPCVPDPCAALGLACRPTGDGSIHECYEPLCTDNEPCTTDTMSGDECVFTPVLDGTTCSTSICVSDQQCLDGVCAGGSTVACDDDDPCTADRCDDVTGCHHEIDDSLVPDDGYDCTLDGCLDGAEIHTPDDLFCDDDLYCTGLEICDPLDSAAHDDGCVATDVPTPPEPSSFCRSYEPCDEPTRTFPLDQQPPGTPCDDGIDCTTGDACTAEGRCEGTPTPACSIEGDCVATAPFPSTIDIPTAHLIGTITQNGAPLPAESHYGSTLTFYLVSRDTDTWHQLTTVTFDGPCCIDYGLVGDGSYESQTIAGVYDLLYRRGLNTSSGNVSQSNLMDDYVNGLRLLREDVVIPTGHSRLDIDIPTTNITGTITQDGTPLPAESYYGSTLTFYLVSRDTDTWHQLTTVTFDGPCCIDYDLVGDGSYESKVLSGRYDLLYRRGLNTSSGNVSQSNLMDDYVNGLRLLQEDILVDGLNQNIDIDIPTTNITGTITQDGAPLSAESYYGSTLTFYLVSRDTDTWHQLTTVTFDGPCCIDYDLVGDGSYESKVLSGRYDLLYRRGLNTSSGNVSQSNLMDDYVNGLRLLQEDILVDGLNQNIDIDIPTTNITGTITQDGAPLPAESYYGSTLTFYLVSRDTDTWHQLTTVTFDGPCCIDYDLVGDGTYTSRVLSGRYDLLYRRGLNTSSGNVSQSNLMDDYVNGMRLLQEDILVDGLNQNIDIDIPTTDVSGTITMNGSPLPAESHYGSTLTFYLVSLDTDIWHQLTTVTFDGPCCIDYDLVGDGTYTSRVISGRYDLLYRRGLNTSSGNVSESNLMDDYVNGLRLLQRGVFINGASQVMDIDIPATHLSGSITQDDGPLPGVSFYGSTVTFYMVPRDTRTPHGFTDLTFDGPCCINYSLVGDGSYESFLPSGVYDVLYRRGLNTSSGNVSESNLMDDYVNGYRVIDACVLVP